MYYLFLGLFGSYGMLQTETIHYGRVLKLNSHPQPGEKTCCRTATTLYSVVLNLPFVVSLVSITLHVMIYDSNIGKRVVSKRTPSLLIMKNVVQPEASIREQSSRTFTVLQYSFLCSLEGKNNIQQQEAKRENMRRRTSTNKGFRTVVVFPTSMSSSLLGSPL